MYQLTFGRITVQQALCLIRSITSFLYYYYYKKVKANDNQKANENTTLQEVLKRNKNCLSHFWENLHSFILQSTLGVRPCL